MRWLEPAKTVLLTGAGFTKSFKGYLAGEIWAVILNQPEIQQNGNLRKCLLREVQYEAVYDSVLNSPNFCTEEKHAFFTAVSRAYKQLHQVVCREEQIDATEMLGSVVSPFAGSSNDRYRGFFFTLNQDLFVEQYYSGYGADLKIPGLHQSTWFRGRRSHLLDENDHVSLPSGEAVGKYESAFWGKSSDRFMYVKLHGSYGWKSATGSEVMVIGREKSGLIAKEPLLQWYFRLFEEVLFAGEQTLVVIGYGFGDRHINQVILDAINKHRLRLYVVSPLEPRDFQQRLIEVHGFNISCPDYGHELWDNLFGYHCGTVRDFFTAGQWGLTEIGKAFFAQIGLRTHS